MLLLYGGYYLYLWDFIFYKIQQYAAADQITAVTNTASSMNTHTSAHTHTVVLIERGIKINGYI